MTEDDTGSTDGGPASVDALTDQVAARLERLTRRAVPLHDLLGLLVDLRPDLAVDAERSLRLAETLRHLEHRGVVEPSKGRTRVHGVELPRSVTLLTNRPDRSRPENPALRFPWVPEMAWAASGPRRSPELHEKLGRISEWIAGNRGRRVVPERERSLEIFGDDKVLGRLVDGVLRGRDATVTALAIVRRHPPMAVAEIDGAAGRAMLVVENGTTFHSALEAAQEHVAAGTPVDLRWIGYGAGEQLAAILPSIAHLAPTAMVYFGDLDPEGLRFAAAGARRCEEVGLPPLRPASRLYARLLHLGRPQHKRHRAGWPADGLAWLGPDLGARLHELDPTGWLAQEWVGVEALSTDPAWCTAPS